MGRDKRVKRIREQDAQDAKRKPILIVTAPLMLNSNGEPDSENYDQMARFFASHPLREDYYLVVMYSADITQPIFEVVYAPMQSKAAIANLQAMYSENIARLSKDFANALKLERDTLGLQLHKMQAKLQQAQAETEKRLNKLSISTNEPADGGDAPPPADAQAEKA